MCGIIGYISQTKKIETNLFYKSFLKQRHRGPDDEGFVFENNEHKLEFLKSIDSHNDCKELRDITNVENSKFILGHNRLSIIDLSSNGHQPMLYKNIIISFNGEIYNYIELKNELISLGYKFKTSTDTEVLLMAFYHWGIECFNKLNGMWAAAFYDTSTKKMILTRDRFGVKPLYYYHQSDAFIFASEAKTLLPLMQQTPKVNKDVVLNYIKYMKLDYSNETFFENIFSLPAGSYLVYENNKVCIEKYWNLAYDKKDIDYTDAKKKLGLLLKESVSLRLRSDVGVGALLSGGLDSSSIVGLCSKEMNRNIESFSAVFDDKSFSECDNIKKTEKLLDLNVNYIKPKENDFIDDLDDFIYSLDFPVKSMSPYAQYSIYKHIHKNSSVKVLLNGQGADEILGGYNSHKSFYLASLLQTFNFQVMRKEINILNKDFSFSKRNLIKDAMKILLRNKFGNQIKQKYQYKIFNNESDYDVIQTYAKYENSDIYNNKLLSDLTETTLPEYLRYEDRNSMRFSLESRLPFLDYRVVEFSFSIPNSFKYNIGRTKRVLRDSMKPYISEDIYSDKRKLGFVTPQEIWQKECLEKCIDDVFLDIKKNGIFDFLDKNEIYKIYEEYKNSRFHDYGFIWRIFYLYKWKNIFNVE